MALKTIRITQKGGVELPNSFAYGMEFTMSEEAAAHYISQGLAEYIIEPEKEKQRSEVFETATKKEKIEKAIKAKAVK